MSFSGVVVAVFFLNSNHSSSLKQLSNANTIDVNGFDSNAMLFLKWKRKFCWRSEQSLSGMNSSTSCGKVDIYQLNVVIKVNALTFRSSSAFTFLYFLCRQTQIFYRWMFFGFFCFGLIKSKNFRVEVVFWKFIELVFLLLCEMLKFSENSHHLLIST